MIKINDSLFLESTNPHTGQLLRFHGALTPKAENFMSQ